MKCEQCDRDLNWNPDESASPAAQAANAMVNGVTVKNWVMFLDYSGYHYFCSRECANAYRDQHKSTGIM